MATLWIREYTYVGSAPAQVGDFEARQLSHSILQIGQEPGFDQTALTFSTSVASAAFGDSTEYVAIIGSAAFHYVVGAAPVATTNALKVPADTLLFVGVKPGQKIAAIAAA